jgi:hypothetical protein
MCSSDPRIRDMGREWRKETNIWAFEWRTMNKAFNSLIPDFWLWRISENYKRTLVDCRMLSAELGEHEILNSSLSELLVLTIEREAAFSCTSWLFSVNFEKDSRKSQTTNMHEPFFDSAFNFARSGELFRFDLAVNLELQKHKAKVFWNVLRNIDVRWTKSSIDTESFISWMINKHIPFARLALDGRFPITGR